MSEDTKQSLIHSGILLAFMLVIFLLNKPGTWENNYWLFLAYVLFGVFLGVGHIFSEAKRQGTWGYNTKKFLLTSMAAFPLFLFVLVTLGLSIATYLDSSYGFTIGVKFEPLDAMGLSAIIFGYAIVTSIEKS